MSDELVDEVGCENAAGLRGQELLPCRASAAGYGADPGVMEDLSDRGGSDWVADRPAMIPSRDLAQARLAQIELSSLQAVCGHCLAAFR